MNRYHLLGVFALFSLLTNELLAQAISPLLRVDQFGYLPNARKVAVISDPQTGFNASESFTPGATYELRKISDNSVAWSGAPQAWNGGATHTQSGDKGWWIDFSTVTAPGAYHLYDVDKKVYSYPFDIGEEVYQEVLKRAVRMYYYQRLGIAKEAAYAGAKWTDGAAFLGANQDVAARSRFAKTDATTERDLRGGWMDAGDVNKYTTFAEGAMLQLLQAYQANPTVFTDDFDIPESGNGVSDLLDEVKWELDFLKRAQDATGNNGLILKVGVDNYNDVSPPSTDTRPRYYLPECTSATLSGAAIFSLAGIVYKKETNAALQSYGTNLIQRAELAWARAKVSTNNFQNFTTDCDDGDIKAGDADKSETEQMESAVIAAIYLYEATNTAQYRDFVESHYTVVDPVANGWWGPYKQSLERALLHYITLAGVSNTASNKIRSQKNGSNYLYSLDDYTAKKDLYRGFMKDEAHHWGSNIVRSNCGNINLDFIQYNLNNGSAAAYREVAEQYLHWMHGTNPLGISMLSNMYAYGGDQCVNEIYHTWFKDSTAWDNAKTDPHGPAPGYVTGGPNKDFSYAQLAPPANQPPQKAYLQFNTGFPQGSWEITEPAIYYQAAYILLLSRIIPAATSRTKEVPGKPTWVIRVSPNPATDYLAVTFQLERSAKIKLEINDAQGKVVYQQKLSFAAGNHLHEIDFNAYPAGVYVVRADDGTNQQSVKVVKP